MAGRYFLPQLSDGDFSEITGGEFHHLTRVLRQNVGDRVVVFDGQGNEADAEITRLDKDRALVHLFGRRHDLPDPRPVIILATAVPKADRFRWLVEKATELGVDRLVPLHTARSVVDPGSMKLEKMRLAVIEACKQSGRNRLMRIDPPMDWEEFVRTLIPTVPTLIADPKGIPLRSVRLATNEEAALALAVGPEGGLTEAELRQAVEAGAKSVSLGRHVLRIETAAVALAAVFALR